jgi:N-acetyltransferase 10
MAPQMQKKKLDSRIHTLIQNGVKSGHRSFFVIIGDRGKDQVVNLHFLLSKARVAARPTVLWCYKKDLGFSSHRKKRMRQLKLDIKRGIKDPDQDNPFDLFISSTDIRYVYYKESEKILGNTYGMCVLQDFEALTPNLLARTIETVEGGGIIVLLLRTMKSLKQLYTMTMDVHSRYRTESHHDITARFNERFILSLGSCGNCLVVDDELNVLPISQGKNIKALPSSIENELTPKAKELKELKESLKDTQPIGSLVECAGTLDQAKAVLAFVDAISEKTLRSTITLTAARGRGKSASLGISLAAAVAYGYSNIFIAAPSPENLKTLFQFLFKGFDALGYEEHLDYNIVQSTNPDYPKAVVRVNIFKNHRQTIQYIHPADAHMLSQAELLIIDEAAAIPLPLVKKLLGNYLVFMASTINGYEGTGRSLSLKLIQQLREQSRGLSASLANADGKVDTGAPTGRLLKEIKLEEPIRYKENDPIESWLNKILCLDCCSSTSTLSRLSTGCPYPSECELYYVNRDTLFSYHPVSEAFLQRMMSLYVASHYKNSPNDLQLMSDAPAHHLFVLLPPVDSSKAVTLPEPLCVIQICLEGEISKQTILNSLSKGQRANGDLIPWCMSQQFQDEDFASLSGARVVRIATHPDYFGMGYGKRALQLLIDYYEGKMQNLNEDEVETTKEINTIQDEDFEGLSLQNDNIKIRDAKTMPPLLLKLNERPLTENLQWIGVSYGLTEKLHRFWKKSGFVPVYLRQTSNELTGEHTCIMLRSLTNNNESSEIKIQNESWINDFSSDFHRRIIELLGYKFKDFDSKLVLSILDAAQRGMGKENSRMNIPKINCRSELLRNFSSHDLKRLKSYVNNMLDYHAILDLVPTISHNYFLNQLSDTENGNKNSEKKLDKVTLSAVQASILAGIGLQHKTMEDLEKDLNIPVTQIMALFMKSLRKIYQFYQTVEEREFEEDINVQTQMKKEAIKSKFNKSSETNINGKRNIEDEEAWDPTQQTLEEDLLDGEDEAMKQFKEKQKEIISKLDLKQYAIGGNEEDWANVKLSENAKGGIVNIKNADSTKKNKIKHGVAESISEKFKKSTTKKRKLNRKSRA